MTYLARQLLMIPCLHFSDDFGGIEPAGTALSAFDSFSRLFATLGMQMKEKKAQPPDAHQRILGVLIDVNADHILLRPCPVRVQKIQHTISTALTDNILRPDTAQKLAGKPIFLQTTTFGQLGKAPLHSIYSRASDLSGNDHHSLTHALRASLLTLQQILHHMRPRCIPTTTMGRQSTIFTDAFFELGDRRYSISATDIPQRWSLAQASRSPNGWGFVMQSDGVTWYQHGSVPPAVLRKFCARRAFIYLLEAIAPVICLVLGHRHLNQFVVIYVDNQAALQALTKGYGRDPSVNNLVSFFWHLVARLELQVALTWVPSELNISDPISRGDMRLAHDHGWTSIPADLTSFYSIVVRCADDVYYATTLAVDECLSQQSGLEQDGKTVPEMVSEVDTDSGSMAAFDVQPPLGKRKHLPAEYAH